MRWWRDESGQAMVMALGSMTLLMGCLALATDVSVLYRTRRMVQTAADAAASAAAIDYFYNGSVSSAATAGANASSANGFAAGSTVTANAACADTTKNCVVMNFDSHITSPYHNTIGYTEAIVSEPAPTIFLGMFNMGRVTVAARAVAGITPSTACLILLDKANDAEALWVKGNGTIQTPNCGVQVNSRSGDAFCDQGNASINAPYVKVTGNQGGGKCAKSPGAPVYTGAVPADDPYAGLPDPLNSCNAGNTTAATNINSATPLPSSLVTSANNTTSTVTCFSGSNVTLANGLTLGSNPGDGKIFVFKNGVQIGGTVTVNGTLDVAGGSFTQGNGTLNVNAPGSECTGGCPLDKALTYVSIGVMQPSSNATPCVPLDQSVKKALLTSSQPCLQLQFGTGAGTINGVIYAPTSLVYLQDQGGSVGAAGVVAYTMFLNSQLTITNSFYALYPASSPNSQIELVE